MIVHLKSCAMRLLAAAVVVVASFVPFSASTLMARRSIP